jgi:hypothetical protein
MLAQRSTYKRPENQSVRHAFHITGRFGIGKGLVGYVLLKTVEILDIPSASGGGGVSEESKYRVFNIFDVVQVKGCPDAGQKLLVRMFLCIIALVTIRA